MNNTSDINDCISIDSDLNEGVASLSKYTWITFTLNARG
jgi:hypothetical protein